MKKIEMIGQMTGGVAHDFNNLLTPIVGYLDFLQVRFADDAKASKMISAALLSADRGRVLVSRLLSFARRQHLETKVVDLRELVGGMKIGRAHVCTPVTNAHLVCRLLLENTKNKNIHK